jgi:hypothetical protein
LSPLQTVEEEAMVEEVDQGSHGQPGPPQSQLG